MFPKSYGHVLLFPKTTGIMEGFNTPMIHDYTLHESCSSFRVLASWQFFLLKLFHLPSELWHTFLLDVSPLFLFLPLNALTLPPCNAQKLIYVKRRLLKVSCLDIMHNASIQSRYQHLLGTALGRAHRVHLLILRWRIWYQAYCRDRGKIEQEVTKSW